MRLSLITIAFILFCFQVNSQVLSEWRGLGRTGVYNETGLLKEWPKEGPELLWFNDSVPNGYSSISIAYNTIYLTGVVDENDAVVALDIKGNVKWTTPYGRAWSNSYSYSRSTATIENNKLYLSSGLGDIACVDAKSGKILWKVKASEKFEGETGRFGISESLLLVDDKIIYTPGGDKTTIVALNKNTGETVWMSKSLKDIAAYISPLLVQEGKNKIIVSMTKKYILGVNPENGKILWKFDFGKYNTANRDRNNQTNTPLYYKNNLYVTSGYNHKSVMLKLSDDLKSASVKWVDSVLDVHHGGAVKVGDYIYGANWTNNRNGNWVCLKWDTGETVYEKEWNNKGSIISAEGMLYCYDEKKGNMALVNANGKDFEIISSFVVSDRKGPHWSHPAIKKGILYIRHGTALMAYNIRK